LNGKTHVINRFDFSFIRKKGGSKVGDL